MNGERIDERAGQMVDEILREHADIGGLERKKVDIYHHLDEYGPHGLLWCIPGIAEIAATGISPS